jgi:parallel beta-helix repeat protein
MSSLRHAGRICGPARWISAVSGVVLLLALPHEAAANCKNSASTQTVMHTGNNLNSGFTLFEVMRDSTPPCTVSVGPGTYLAPQNLNLQFWIPNGITVRSLNGAASTILRADWGSAVAIWPIGGSCPSNAFLEGFTLEGPSGGVYVAAGPEIGHPGCPSNQITNVTLRNLIINAATTPPDGHGILFFRVQNSVIDSTTIVRSFANGIFLANSSNRNIVMNNTIQSTTTQHAIAIQTSNDNIIVGNTISGAAFDGIILNSNVGLQGPGSSRNRIERNNISGHTVDGVTLTDASRFNYIGLNAIASNAYHPSMGDSSVRNAGTGIWINNASHGTYLFANDLSGHPENGLSVWTSNSTYLQGNVVHGNRHGGIYISDQRFNADPSAPAPHDLVLHGNSSFFNRQSAQIETQGAINLEAAYNYLSGAQGAAMAGLTTKAFFFRSNTNTVAAYENIVSEVGARAWIQDTFGAVLYRNRFLKGTNIPNPPQTDGRNGQTWSLTPSTVQWDGGAILGGNHWSDHTAAAGNPDPSHPYNKFIGNTNGAPYVDRYPYQSEALVTAYAPVSVQVIEPLAGSVLAAGSRRTLRWLARGCPLVNLSYYGVGVGETAIAVGYPNTGFYAMTVPAVTFGTDYHVRVRCMTSNVVDMGVFADSASFTIAASDLVLLNPGRGTRATNGSTIRVAWKKSAAVASVNIAIKTAGGPETVVASNATGTFRDIVIPGSIADSSRVTIRIQGSGSATHQDSVDGYFMVRGSSPGFTTAFASQIFRIGSVRILEWHGPSTAVTVDLDLYLNGTLNRSIVKNLPDYGQYQWLTPDAQSSNAVIRATFKNESGATVGTINSASFFISSTGAPPEPVEITGGQDFDGDGRSELTIFRPSSGTWLTRNSSTNYATNSSRQWGFPTDLPVAGDYDGDGRVDFAVYRPSTGTWHVLQSLSGYTASATYALGSGSDLPVAGDYDGDGRMDPATFRRATGVWSILSSSTNHATVVTRQWGNRGDVPVPNDYDGDGLTDLTVYRPTNGTWYVLTSTSSGTASREFQWGLPGDIPVPGDYDGDAQAEPAVYRPSNGTWYFLRSSTNFSTSSSFQWGLSGDVPTPGDYDGDNRTDLAVYRPSLGNWYIAFSTTSYSTSASYQWGIAGDFPMPNSAIAHALAVRSTLATSVRASDFDGDRKSDLTVYRPSSGAWHTRRSSTNYGTSASFQFGVSGDVPLPHDYDGDGQTDPAVYRPSTRFWHMLRSSSGYTSTSAYQWGLSGDVPAPGDYDGDALSDPTVFRPSTGFWHVLYSSTNYASTAAYEWGANGDIPVQGDYDGDAVSDFAVFRPSNGMWFIRYSSTGFATSAAIQFGLGGDIAVPGEYDGDGRTDIAVYRPANGVWYVLRSSTNYTGFVQYQFGLSADTPVPGDFDGDRRTDFAVWRPSTATWYILKSTTGFTAFDTIQWGLSGDIPILKRP